MDRFEAMRTLVAAVDGGSLSAASRALGVPLPTVSRRVSDLEAYLRAQLVVRTSRKLLLTETGRAFVATCRRVLDELDEAERAATGEYRSPRGHLLITAPVMFGRLHVEPVVLDFLKTYPEIDVRLILADYYIDLAENQIDLALRIGNLPDSSLIAAQLGMVNWVTCASPAYLERHGTPAMPHILADHRCIAFEGLYASNSWNFGSGKAATAVSITPRFSVNTAMGAIDAAVAGAGIVRVLSYQVDQAIADGTLTMVLSGFQPDPIPVHLVHAAAPMVPLKLRAFKDFAIQRLRDRMATLQESKVSHVRNRVVP